VFIVDDNTSFLSAAVRLLRASDFGFHYPW
jgi:hypothetical protein